jgi:glycosidase
MQWSARPGLGFTSGTAWSSAQPDSLTTTVAAQDTNPRSLLNLYRRLIHLRRSNDALAVGTLVPLTAGNGQVVAYLRRGEDGKHAVLVVANLGATAVSRIPVTSRDSVLTAGRYGARNLLGGPRGAPLVVRRDGRIHGYVPLPGRLAPRQSLVLDLSPASR